MENIYFRMSPDDVAGGLINGTFVYEPKSASFYEKVGPYWWHVHRRGYRLASTVLTDNELCECYYAEYDVLGELCPIIRSDYTEWHNLN